MTSETRPEVKLPAVPPLGGNFKPEQRSDEYEGMKFFDAATVEIEHLPDIKTLTYLTIHIPGVGDARFYISREERLALIRELAREDLW